MSKGNSVIVIGGGLGGLSAAISLAQRGFKVRLFEKNSQFGGKMNRILKDGVRFDLGPSVLAMPNIFERLFEKSKMKMNDYVELVEENRHYRTFFADGTRLDLMKELGAMRATNQNLSDKDIREYEDFLRYGKRIYEETHEHYFENGSDDWSSYAKFHNPLFLVKRREYFRAMQESINKRVTNPYLRELLGSPLYFMGVSGRRAPGIYNALTYLNSKHGVWYVKGGLHNLAEGLTQLASDVGVELMQDTEVHKINITDDEIVSLKLSNGDEESADYFVSNLAPEVFYQLSNPEMKSRPTETHDPGPSHFVMLLDLNKHFDILEHHNVFLSENLAENDRLLFDDKKLPSDPTIYVIDESEKSAQVRIKIVTPIPMTDKEYALEDYMNLRHAILTKLERMGLTDLRKHIVGEVNVTPHDIAKTFNSPDGAMYGTKLDARINKGFKHGKRSKKFNNLYFVGASVHPSATLAMIALNGQQVARMIRDKDRN